MQNQIDVDRMKAEIMALKEKLLAERDKKFECDLQIGISGILDIYTAYRIRLAEVSVELEGLDVIEKALADYEITLQREKQAFEAAQAERRKRANKLVKQISGLEPGPEKSLLLFRLTEILDV